MTIPRTVVKGFQGQALKVPGAELITSPVYSDVRGSLYESFHVLKMKANVAVSTIRGVYPPRKVVFGPVAQPGEEYVYLIRGKLFVVLIDAADQSVRDSLELVPGLVLRIPGLAIHGFLSLEDDTIFDLVRTAGGPEARYEFNDASLAIEWPTSELPLASIPKPEGRIAPLHPDFAVMGSNGMIGSAFVRELETRGHTWVQLRSRLHQHSSIRNELAILHPTISVLIAAGVGTRPNTRWCEDHRIETIDANVTGQLAIAEICRQFGLHLTLIGTSGFYHYDEAHPLGAAVGFVEEDPPNHGCNFYYRMRVYLEELLNESGAIANILNLRALFPFDHKVTSSSLIGKLLRFARINCIPTSMTVLPGLVPLAVDMMKDHDVGHVNWVCRGVASNGDVLAAYKAVVDPAIAINEVQVSQETSRATGNSAAYIVPAKLIAKFGEEKVPEVKDAINNLMELIKQERAAQ
jgi:dTDP-4-dehydrorhamnose 3,5-epimerase-like enzyme